MSMSSGSVSSGHRVFLLGTATSLAIRVQASTPDIGDGWNRRGRQTWVMCCNVCFGYEVVSGRAVHDSVDSLFSHVRGGMFWAATFHLVDTSFWVCFLAGPACHDLKPKDAANGVFTKTAGVRPRV